MTIKLALILIAFAAYIAWKLNRLRKSYKALTYLEEAAWEEANYLLKVTLNEKLVCYVQERDIGSEVRRSYTIPSNSHLKFIDRDGIEHTHHIGEFSGWIHLSVIVHNHMGCQADCLLTETMDFNQEDYSKGKIDAIRFQPFFLPGSSKNNSELMGKGLFARGMHYSGYVTNGKTRLSCECDNCYESFLINSFHTGFSNRNYFYSESGEYTLSVPIGLNNCPPATQKPDEKTLSDLEDSLPLAPDGSKFQYLNPFRCPHCKSPYINFIDNPGLREKEYYGNYYSTDSLLKIEDFSLESEVS